MEYDFTFAESFGVYKWTIDFDAHCNNSILYTNITGGEWKHIRNPRNNEVIHVLELEESRPDLLVYLRKSGVLMIGEGKSSIDKLFGEIDKHVQVYNDLSIILSKETISWNSKESNAELIPMLLWCSISNAEQIKDINNLFLQLLEALENSNKKPPNILVGLEVIKTQSLQLITKPYIFYLDKNRSTINLVKELQRISVTRCIINNLNNLR